MLQPLSQNQCVLRMRGLLYKLMAHSSVEFMSRHTIQLKISTLAH